MKKLGKTRAARTVALSLLTAAFLTGCSRSGLDWCAIRECNLEHDLEILYSDVDLPERPLILRDVLEIAMCRNIDLLVKRREIAVQSEVANRDYFKMLPNLTFNYEGSGRTEAFAETSRSLTTGTISNGAIAREHATNRRDITLTWNILDFGLSYYRARQEKNRIFMVAMERQRVRQNLIYDIVTEYWKAVIAKKAVDGAETIIVKAEERQQALDRQIANRIISEIEGLRNQDRLIAVRLQLQGYERQYESAKRQLASLMGLPPMIPFEIAGVTELALDVEVSDVRELEDMALHSRPELYVQDVQEKIMTDEVRAAVLEMFPNAQLFAGDFYDRDFYLINNNWAAAGVKAAWDLLRTPQHLANRRRAKQQEQLARDSRLSLSIGIMAQVHLAHLRYLEARAQYDLSEQQNEIKARLFDAAEKEVERGVAHTADLFSYEVDALLAEINALRAYAEVQISLEQLSNSVGKPLYFNAVDLLCYKEQLPEGEASVEATVEQSQVTEEQPTAEQNNTKTEEPTAETSPRKPRPKAIRHTYELGTFGEAKSTISKAPAIRYHWQVQ